MVGEAVLGVAAIVDVASYDRKIRFGSQALRRNCQTYWTRLAAGSWPVRDDCNFGRNRKPFRDVPAGLIDQEHGMFAWRDPGGDLGQAHRLGVAPGQEQTDCRARHRTDRANDVG